VRAVRKDGMNMDELIIGGVPPHPAGERRRIQIKGTLARKIPVSGAVFLARTSELDVEAAARAVVVRGCDMSFEATGGKTAGDRAHGEAGSSTQWSDGGYNLQDLHAASTGMRLRM